MAFEVQNPTNLGKICAHFIALLVVLTFAGACSSTGDFGRERIAPSSFLDRRPGADVQGNFQIVQTDEEKQMRRSTQRFVSYVDQNSWLSKIRFTAKAIAGSYPDQSDYYEWLRVQPFARSAGRYSKLLSEVQADSATLPAAFLAICAVKQTDQRRAVAAQSLADTEQEILENLVKRREENQQFIAEFIAVVGFRYDSYSYALEHLLVETPHESARLVDDKLNTLALQVQAANARQFCSN